MQTWVKITKREKGKRTLIDCKCLSINPKTKFSTVYSIQIAAKVWRKSPKKIA